MSFKYKRAEANREPALNSHRVDFEKAMKRALEIAVLRAKEVLELAYRCEDLGRKGMKGGAAYNAGLASEIASQYAHLAAEKYFDDDNSKQVQDAEKLFAISDAYNRLVVEPPSCYPENAARMYRLGYERADKKKLETARELIARGTLDFCIIASEVEPENKEIAETVKYCKRIVRKITESKDKNKQKVVKT